DEAGFYYTGDLGLMDGQGRLRVTGRAGLLIDAGGRKVNPLEVEQVLEAHPDVRECAVTGVGLGSGRLLAALVVVARKVSAQELRDHCRERLSAYKVPSFVVFRDALPRSPLGKVLRGELALTDEDMLAGPRGPAASKDATTYLLAELAALLGKPVEELDADAPVLSVKFDSIMLMQLRMAIERDLQVSAPMAEILGHASIAQVGRHLDKVRAASTAPTPAAAGSAPGTFPVSVRQRHAFALLRAGEPARCQRTFCAAVAGSLDAVAVQAAVQAVFARHPMLRSRIERVGEGPAVQRIVERGSFLVEEFATRSDSAAEFAAAVAATPLDLDRHGPLRLSLATGPTGEVAALALTVHGLVADLWSAALLLRETAMALNAVLGGAPLYLPRLDLDYADFSRWTADTEVFDAEVDTEGDPEVVAEAGSASVRAQLPAPAPVPAPAAGRWSAAAGEPAPSTDFDAPGTRALRRAAASQGTDIPTLLLAALVTACATTPELAGARLGVTSWGRDRPGFRDVVGAFSHVEPLPVALDGVPIGSLTEAMRLVERARIDAPPQPAELADVVFTDCVAPRPEAAKLVRFVEGGGGERLTVGQTGWQAVAVPRGRSPHLVEARLVRADREVSLRWDHDASRLPREVLTALRRRFTHLLQSAATDPNPSSAGVPAATAAREATS
ncbi:MAG TPA: condensation domain-containing protein, partial [Actinospica sp.]|nr:condensation domain-containing protein [Actinospica sp.]